jgi:hypothetical protein
MRWSRKWGVSLVSIWLVVSGVMHLVPALHFNGSGNILALVAIAGGVLLWLDR